MLSRARRAKGACRTKGAHCDHCLPDALPKLQAGAEAQAVQGRALDAPGLCLAGLVHAEMRVVHCPLLAGNCSALASGR